MLKRTPNQVLLHKGPSSCQEFPPQDRHEMLTHLRLALNFGPKTPCKTAVNGYVACDLAPEDFEMSPQMRKPSRGCHRSFNRQLLLHLVGLNGKESTSNCFSTSRLLSSIFVDHGMLASCAQMRGRPEIPQTYHHLSTASRSPHGLKLCHGDPRSSPFHPKTADESLTQTSEVSGKAVTR